MRCRATGCWGALSASRFFVRVLAVLSLAGTCLLAACGDGNIDLGASNSSGSSATTGTSPTTAATPGGNTTGGFFSLSIPTGATSTQVNVLSGPSTPSVNNGSDFSFVAVMPAASLAANQRVQSECFSSSAAVPWVFMSSAQANSQTVIVDQNAVAGWVAVPSNQSGVQAAFANQIGVATVNLPAGNLCIAAWNTGPAANSIGAKLRPLSDYNFTNYLYNGVALNVVFSLAAGQSASWAFSLRAGTHMILEGGNSGGGQTYILNSTGITAFQNSNGAAGRFTYVTQSDGTSLCGTGPASTDDTPNNCDNFDQLPAGTYYYAITNPTNLPISFVAFAIEYIPQ
jgi:hypothetical protein